MFPRHHFSHIFIDEAGHATEPECIIPVADLLDPNHPRGGQLVLAGDPKQLGPILRSPISVKYGLGKYVKAAWITTMKWWSLLLLFHLSLQLFLTNFYWQPTSTL